MKNDLKPVLERIQSEAKELHTQVSDALLLGAGRNATETAELLHDDKMRYLWFHKRMQALFDKAEELAESAVDREKEAQKA